MNDISTAEEFLTDDRFFNKPLEEHEKEIYIYDIMTVEDIKVRMIEFAQLHVKAALKAASHIANDWENSGELAPEILNAYPEENIQ